MSNPTLEQVIAAITPLFSDGAPPAPPIAQPPVAQPPASSVLPPDLAGKRVFVSNVPWETPGRINRTMGNVIDATSAWLPQFTPTSNSARAGRLQVVDAASQSVFRDYILFRNSDGVVLQRQEGISATIEYWVGPGNPDPAGTFIAQLEVGVQYTLAVLNRADVTESGQPALDIYQ